MTCAAPLTEALSTKLAACSLALVLLSLASSLMLGFVAWPLRGASLLGFVACVRVFYTY